MKDRGLVIGYGNSFCGDDGVGLYVINALRRRLGLRELRADEDGTEDLGHPVDTIMVHQLTPELVPWVSAYRWVVFVDAHMGTIPEEVRVVPVKEEYGFHAVTHHMSPGMLLATTRRVEGRAPWATLVTIKGEDLAVGFGLTEACRQRADRAVEEILKLHALEEVAETRLPAN